MKLKDARILLSKVLENLVLSDEHKKDLNYQTPAIAFWGIAGSGKTNSMEEFATEHHMPIITWRLGEELAENVSIPKLDEWVKMNSENKEEIARTIISYYADSLPRMSNAKRREKDEFGNVVEVNELAIDFESIKDYISNYEAVKSHYESLGLTINDAPGMVMFFDELNRITDPQLFQMMFQMLERGQFKSYKLPPRTLTAAACNPPKGYIVGNWFDDKAFANRLIHIKIVPTIEDFIEFARLDGSGYDEQDIEMVKEIPGILFDKEEISDFNIPKPTLNLRTFAYFSNLVRKIDWEGYEHIQTELIQSIFGESFVGSVVGFLNESNLKRFTPEQILFEYDKYDVGPQPFVSVYNEDLGRDVFEDGTIYDSIRGQKANSKYRKRFLEEVLGQGKNRNEIRSDVISSVNDDIADYIADNFNDEEFRENFLANRLRFVRFVADLPIEFIHPLISGIDKKIKEKWGGDEDYKNKANFFKFILKGEDNDLDRKASIKVIRKISSTARQSVAI